MKQITKGGHGIPEATLKRINEALSKPLKTGTNGPRIRGNRVVDEPTSWLSYDYQTTPYSAVPDTSEGSTYTIPTISGSDHTQHLAGHQQAILNDHRLAGHQQAILNDQRVYTSSSLQSGAAIQHLQEQYNAAQEQLRQANTISNLNSLLRDIRSDSLSNLVPDEVLVRLNIQD